MGPMVWTEPALWSLEDTDGDSAGLGVQGPADRMGF